MNDSNLRTVRVYLLPTEFEPEQLRGSMAVVVDILRASTTITTALANGASCVKPCLTTEDARAHRVAVKGNCLLGGERGGVRIDGFDLTNSPTDYGSDKVRNTQIAFTTTNGTRALLRSRIADHTFIGAFVNLPAIAARLSAGSGDVSIVCAGTDGEITGEDVLFAGALAARLRQQGLELSDSAVIAERHWSGSVGQYEQLSAALCDTQGGRNLLRLGYDRDIRLCAEIGRYETVPRLTDELLLRGT